MAHATSPYRFDFAGLYAALDERRSARGISWQRVAEETGVAASTIVRTRAAGVMEADGVRAMIRWLGLAPEVFIRTSEGSRRLRPMLCLASARGKLRRFDTVALHAALDTKRRSEGLRWEEVASKLGGPVNAAMLTRLRRRGRIGVALMVASVGWLQVSVESLTYEASR